MLATVNVVETADKFLEELDANGFNEILPSQIERECCWHEQYAIFVLYFDTMDFEEENQYYRFDSAQFEYDFEQHLRKTFEGCEINFSRGCNEWEIIGPGYKEFYAKHMDRLEELECSLKRSCHWVYHPEKQGSEQMEIRKGQL